MCEETKRSFMPQTSNDAVEVGAMFDLHLEQLEELTAIVYLHAKATIVAAMIVETGVGDQEGVRRIVQRAEEVMAELTEGPPVEPTTERGPHVNA